MGNPITPRSDVRETGSESTGPGSHPNSYSPLSVLTRISIAASDAKTQDSLWDITFRELSAVLDTTGFILAVYDHDSQTVKVVKQIEAGAELPGGSFPLGEGFTSRVIRTGEPLLIRHWSTEGPRVQVQYATDRPGLPESGVTVPLRHGSRVLGVMSLQSYKVEAYSEEDVQFLTVVGFKIGSALERLRLTSGYNTELQKQVSELETVLGELSDGLLRLDVDGRVVSLNRAARQLFCLGDRSLILGQPLDKERWGQWPLCSRAVAEAMAPAVQALRNGESLEETEVEVQGDRRLVLNFKSTPIRDANGKVYGGLIVFRDVTGRREVERLKDDVLSIASHDLRTPLTALKMQAQILLRQMEKGRASREIIEKGLHGILEHVDRQVKILNSLLDLTRLESGRLTLERASVDLSDLAGKIIQSVRATSPQHSFVLRSSGPADGYWDESRLSQVLQNLLTNAVKYSPNGGIVEVGIVAGDEEVAVRVRDGGVGLEREDLQNVFGRFYRAGNAGSLDGTGLGLYICQGIVAAHGGSIWAESPGLGQGSTFCFRLPRWGGGEAQLRPRVEQLPPDTNSGISLSTR